MSTVGYLGVHIGGAIAIRAPEGGITLTFEYFLYTEASTPKTRQNIIILPPLILMLLISKSMSIM